MARSSSFRLGRVSAHLRGRVWYLTYYEQGRRRQPRVGPDRDAARQMAAEINSQLEVGTPSTLMEHSILDVLSDMAAWFSQDFGKLDAVRAAGQLLSVSSWASLVDLTLLMVERGELSATRHGNESHYKRRLLAVYFDASADHPRYVWIPVHKINEALTRRHILCLDLPRCSSRWRAPARGWEPPLTVARKGG